MYINMRDKASTHSEAEGLALPPVDEGVDAGGVDAAFSLQPEELKMLVTESQLAAVAGGSVVYGGGDCEQASKKYRRSIYISQDVKAGDVLTDDNLKIIRPGLGLAPKYYPLVLGQRISKGALKGTALSWELLKDE